jgi:hypothetical protein
VLMRTWPPWPNDQVRRRTLEPRDIFSSDMTKVNDPLLPL